MSWKSRFVRSSRNDITVQYKRYYRFSKQIIHTGKRIQLGEISCLIIRRARNVHSYSYIFSLFPPTLYTFLCIYLFTGYRISIFFWDFLLLGESLLFLFFIYLFRNYFFLSTQPVLDPPRKIVFSSRSLR